MKIKDKQISRNKTIVIVSGFFVAFAGAAGVSINHFSRKCNEVQEQLKETNATLVTAIDHIESLNALVRDQQTALDSLTSDIMTYPSIVPEGSIFPLPSLFRDNGGMLYEPSEQAMEQLYDIDVDALFLPSNEEEASEPNESERGFDSLDLKP